MGLKAKSTGKHSKAIIDGNGVRVGNAIMLSDGFWGAFDLDENRIAPKLSFQGIHSVIMFFEMRSAGIGL
jgi:hypothetical protein